MLDRTEALAMLKASAPDHLVVHALETEAVMRALAAHMGRDPETWGLAGLLHDLDYPETKDTPKARPADRRNPGRQAARGGSAGHRPPQRDERQPAAV